MSNKVASCDPQKSAKPRWTGKHAACAAVIASSAAGNLYANTPLTDVTVSFADIAIQAGLADYNAVGTTVHGPGTIFADLNNDGYPDIYAVDKSGNTLYINVRKANGEREFQSVAGANPGANSSAAAPGDYDNDGDLDLFVAIYNGPNVLYKNMLVETGSLQFQNVTAQTVPSATVAGTTQAGLAQSFDSNGENLSYSYTASWGDVNRDGFLDLFIGTHNGLHGNNPIVGGTPGMRDTFYLNQGDGTFLDVSEVYDVTGALGPDGETGDSQSQYNSSMASMFVDINNDRWPDLIVTNKTRVIGRGSADVDQLYLNNGVNNAGVWQGFNNVTHTLPGGFISVDYSKSPMSIVVADIDNDGDFDLTYSDDSAAEVGGTPGTNELIISQLSQTGQLGFTVDHTSVPAGFSWGTVFADFDNNGFEDLFVAGANCCTRGFNSADWLYMNAAGIFSERAVSAGISVDTDSDGRANATADFDRDGWQDLLQVYNDGSAVNLYRNQGAAVHPARRSVTIKLVGNPNSPGAYVSSKDAIGARATLIADINGDGSAQANGGESQIREVASGYNMMSTTSSLELEFGMGLAASGSLQVQWPSGRTTTNTIQAGQHYVLNETGGLSVLNFEQVAPPADSFVFCAVEGGDCVLPRSGIVRYGANGQYFEQLFDAGSVSCSNAVFGDPIRRTVKSCEFQLLPVTPTPSGFVHCANENGVCALPGPATIRYGANGQYAQQSFAGGNVACTNAVFGDPIRGTVKTCEYELTIDTPAPPPTGFIHCANENGVCVLPAAATIRYGANGQYVEQSFAGGNVACTNAVFGDPIRGTVKTCEYELTIDTPAPPPAPTGFIHCANENGVCALPGPATVRYGANGQYAQQFFTGGNVACTNAVFGDPIRRTVKTCEFLSQ